LADDYLANFTSNSLEQEEDEGDPSMQYDLGFQNIQGKP